MNGPELARFENAMNGKRERNELYSEEAQWVPQYTLEEVLRRHAVSLPGVDIQFGCELAGFEQDGDGVTATVRDLQTGAPQTVRCAYLVGADGARSSVREAIGAQMQGASTVFKNYSIIFRAPDLPRRQVHGDAIMHWLVNADVPALLGPMDQHGLWFFMATKLPDNVDPATIDPVELIRRGTGLHDLRIEVVRTDPWSAYSLIADRYADRRVFLAGDACRLHPPFGGFGMNMGIGDAVDLGWKLAAVLKGWGGPSLLGTYEEERRPVHQRVIREAETNYATVGNQLVRPLIEAPGPADAHGESDDHRPGVGDDQRLLRPGAPHGAADDVRGGPRDVLGRLPVQPKRQRHRLPPFATDVGSGQGQARPWQRGPVAENRRRTACGRARCLTTGQGAPALAAPRRL